MRVLDKCLKASCATLLALGWVGSVSAADLDSKVDLDEVGADGSVQAESSPVSDYFEGFLTRENLLGDPFGLRQTLRDHGLNTTIFYVNQAASNAAGGEVPNQLIYSDMFFFGFDYDLEKSPFKIKGGSLHATITNRNGDNLVEEAGLGTNLLVNEVFGQGNIWRLNHLFYEQDLFDDKLTVKLGRINGSFDFFNFSCKFQNLTFCSAIPSYITPNYTPFPGHTWGAVTTVRPIDNLYVKTGVLEINSDTEDENNAFVIEPIGAGEGIRSQVEIGYNTNFGGLTGLHRVGFFYDNVGAENVGTGVQEDSLRGFYYLGEQEVWRDKNVDGRGITVFASVTQGDPQVSALEQVAEIGAFIQGPFKARVQDEIGMAFGRIKTNDLITDITGDGGSEFPLEVFYSAKVTPAITLQPNFQYIFNPGGVDANEDVAVIGLKSVVVF